MICPYCGKQIDENDKICSSCGSALTDLSAGTKTEYYASDKGQTAPISAADEDTVQRPRSESPTKKQYYRYRPDEKHRSAHTKKAEASAELYHPRGRGKKKDTAPKRKKHNVGRNILRIIIFAVIGFIVGFAVYAGSVTLINRIKNINSGTADETPAATAAPTPKSDKSESTKTTEKPKPTESRSESSENRVTSAPKTEESNPRNAETNERERTADEDSDSENTDTESRRDNTESESTNRDSDREDLSNEDRSSENENVDESSESNNNSEERSTESDNSLDN